MVSWIDLLPTLVDVAGGAAPAGIDGRSFVPVLRGERAEHRDRIFTTHSSDGRMNIYPIRSVRTADWKYIRNLHPEFYYSTHVDIGRSPDAGAYFGSWEEKAKTDPAAAALVRRYHERPAEELYDLAADPLEQRNLAAEPAHAARLAALG
jgi:arylsulfatase A-like enzyme